MKKVLIFIAVLLFSASYYITSRAIENNVLELIDPQTTIDHAVNSGNKKFSSKIKNTSNDKLDDVQVVIGVYDKDNNIIAKICYRTRSMDPQTELSISMVYSDYGKQAAYYKITDEYYKIKKAP